MILINRNKLLNWTPLKAKQYKGWSWNLIDITADDPIVQFEFHFWNGEGEQAFIDYHMSKSDPELHTMTAQEMAEEIIEELGDDQSWRDFMNLFDEE